MKDRIAIIGAGGHAKVIIDIIEKAGQYQIVAIIDQNENLWNKNLLEYPIIGGNDSLKDLKVSIPELKAIIAIGDNYIREKINKELDKYNIEKAIAIHPSAQISRNVTIGAGTVIMANVAINIDTVIGLNCIINTGATIDHENVLDDYCHISPGAHLAGSVHVGTYTHICTGANIISGIRIGSDTIIGAGSSVIRDIPSKVIAVGVPAKVIKSLA